VCKCKLWNERNPNPVVCLVLTVKSLMHHHFLVEVHSTYWSFFCFFWTCFKMSTSSKIEFRHSQKWSIQQLVSHSQFFSIN
jgi:hypothetical protein